jgi:hypothetical protein
MILGWLGLAVAILASYRITRFLVEDSLMGMGPDSGSWLSTIVDHFAYEDESGTNRSFLRGKIGDLLTCTWCLGFWVSCAVVALMTWTLPWVNGTDPTPWIITAFAVAGGQGYVSSRMNA